MKESYLFLFTNILIFFQLGQPDEPLEELPYPRLIENVKIMFDEFKKKEVVIFDGFSFDISQLPALVNLIGFPSFVIVLNASKDAAVAGHKRKNEMDAAAELTEEENEKIEGEIKKLNEFAHYFKSIASESFSTNIYEVNAGTSLANLLRNAENLFFKRVFTCNSFLVDKQEEVGLEKIFANICSRYNIEFINVPLLIRREIVSKSELAKVLRSQYLMRWTEQPEEYPSNYTPDLVIKLIKQHLSSLALPSRYL